MTRVRDTPRELWPHWKVGFDHAGRLAIGRDVIAHQDLFIGRAQQKRSYIEIALVQNCTKEERKHQMKPSTKDQIEGTLHDLKGKVKEKAGKVSNNPNLIAEGQNENLAGKVQKKVGQIEKVLEK